MTNQEQCNLNTNLIKSIENGDLEQVKYLLE
jgi:hypothetical protein